MTIARQIADWFGASLNRRLLAILILVLGGLSTIFLFVVVEVYRDRIAAEQALGAERYNALLQATLENAMLKRDLPGLEAVLADVARGPDIRSLRILDPRREVRFASGAGAGDVGVVMGVAEIGQRGVVPEAAQFRLDDPISGEVFRAVTPVANREACRECHGPVAESPINGILVVDYDLSALGAEARRNALWLTAVGLLVIATATAAVGLAVARGVIAPVAGLTRAMLGMRRGDWATPTTNEGRDEIGQLRRSFFDLAAELRATVDRLKASEAGLQSVIDAIPDGIRVIDRDFRIVKANMAYAAQAGMPLERLIGQPCHALSHRRATPCPETLVCCPLVELRGGADSLTCRQIHQDADGLERHVEIAAATLEFCAGSGATPFVVEAIRDLDRVAKLGQEHRLSELGMFAAGLAHEIHNPLNALELLARAIEFDLDRGDRARVGSHLANLQEEITRTLKLTDSLLALCMPPGERQLLDLAPLVESALAILRLRFETIGVRLVVDVPAGLRILASKSDLHLSLTNLVLNALHAMPEGGDLCIRAWRDGTWIKLEVADTGCGIEPSDQARILLPFWSRRADRSQGRGLGLPLVKAALDRAGGRLEITSMHGKGSCFTLVYPDPDATGRSSMQ